MSDLTVTREGFPHGLRCIDCHERIPPGANYWPRLIEVRADAFITELICLSCALGPTAKEPA